MNEILDEKKKLTERSPLIAEFKKKIRNFVIGAKQSRKNG